MKNVFDSVRFNNKPSKGSNLGFVFFLMLIASSQIVFAQPDTLWTKIHSGQVIADGMHVEQTTDGGFIITGRVSDVEYTNNIWLIKTDAIGDTLWTKRYFPTGSSNGNSVIQTSDGGYIIAGNYNTSPNNISDGIIIKTNSTGDTLWTLNLGAYANSESLSDISQISSGGYIAVGSKDSDIWLVKINTSGDTLWTRTFGSTSYSESGTSVIESSSGGFIITGMTYENNRDIILIKTDASGNSAWSKQFGTSNEPEQGYDLVELADGSLAITGYTNSNGAGASDVWLIKTNSSGDTLWTKTFGGGYSDYGYSIGKTNDGGLILTGRFQPSNNDNSDVYIIKTDTIGNKIWEKKIGGSDTDYGMSIQQTSDGGYIVVGTTESFGTYGSVYLIRISSDPPPTVPTNLTTTTGNEQVTLRWDANSESDLAKYRIYRDTSSPATTLIDSVVASSPPDTFYTDTGLTNSTIYYYRITAVDSSGNESGYSNEVHVSPTIVPNGLVGYYTFTDSSIDGSGYGNDGINYGATLTVDRFGNANSAYIFDGVDDYINPPNSAVNDFGTTPFSVSLWMKKKGSTGSYGNPEGIITSYWQNGSADDKGWFIYRSTGVNSEKLRFGVNDQATGNNLSVYTTTSLDNDEYYHIVAVRNTSTELVIYVNGVFNNSAIGNEVNVSKSDIPFYIGRIGEGSSDPYFDGNIDDIRIYNRALAEAEIQTLYLESTTPLTGSYNIGIGGDYATFIDAVSALKYNGVSGPVTFNVLNGTYTEQIEIGSITGVSATDTIVFQSQSGVAADVTLTYAATSSSYNWVVKLNGADNVTFQNMTLSATGANYARVFDLSGDADYNTITNNTLTGQSTTSSSINYAIIYSYNASVDNTLISNNIFINGGTGIKLDGGTLSQGTVVDNNNFTDQGYYAVHLTNQDAPVVTSNTITSSGGSLAYGIRARYCDNGLQINKNNISGISNGHGIQLEYCDGTAVSNGLVANNFVQAEGTSTTSGISLNYSTYQNVYYNSVNISGGSTTNRAFFYYNSGGNINVKNNIFSAPDGGYAYRVSSTSAIASSDNNDLYSTGNYVARWGSNDLSDLSALQSVSGMDANSVSVNPRFTSDSDLHTTTTWLDSLGTPLASVTDDIDGEARDGTYPDIGADEFTAVGTPLSGTKTISASGNYATFNEAIDSLTTFGVSGPVIFNVLSGTYTEQIEIGSITGVSATDTIVFQSQSGTASDVTLTYAATGSSDNWVVKLNGADYITFKNMTLSATGTSYARVFNLTGDADNNTITNNILTGKSTTSNSTNYAVIYSSNASVDNTLINSNTFINGGTGIYLDGVSGTLSQGTEVNSNTFTDQGYRAVYLRDQDSPVINGNTITSSDGAMDFGIYAYYCDNSLQIKKNRISGIDGASVQLINCSGTAVSNGLVANNFVEGEGTSYADGIEIVGSSYQNIYYNSVNIPSASTTNRALNIQSGSNINVKNNIFTTPGGGYAYYTSQPSAIASSDYNDLYSTGNYVARWGSSDLSDLSALQSASGMDANSVSVNPRFTSNIDLHTTTTWLDSLGTPLAMVIDDIDGETRDGTYPDIGADEFTAVGTPLAGTKTIGASGNYATFNEALDSLHTFGVSGPVIFNVLSGTYTEQIEITEIPGASATNTITFTSQSGDSTSVILSYSASSTNDNFVIKLNGADYITFRNMTLAATGASYARIFDLVGNADNNTVSNNVLSGKSTTSSSDNYALIFSENQSTDNTIIRDNLLVNGSFGVFLEGISNSSLSSGNELNQNTFADQYYRGIYLGNQDAPIVGNNSITTSSTSNSYRGIYANYCDNNLKIHKNKITGGRGTGIYLENCDGAFTAQALVANNFIQIGGTSTAYGMSVNNSNYQNIYYNSVNITGTSTSAGRALYTSTGGNLNLVNNIFTNTGGGYAYYVGTTSAIATSNYNIFYATGTNLAYWGGAQTDLPALQTASSMDANSISSDPGFESTTDLHITVSNDDGTPLTEVTDDIDSEPRDAVNPDIGADEFIPANVDGIIEVPAEIATIQGAINVAVNGDSIKVSPGTYLENINFNGKNIIVIGEDRETTIIDGNQNGSVVTFDSGETLVAVLSGFTITNGSTNQNGGGIYCYFSSPTIENCTIKGNTADSGGGIKIIGGSPMLLNLLIKENTGGGGIDISGQATAPTIDHCIIRGNNGTGIFIWDSSPIAVKFSEISNNSVGGIFFQGQGSFDIINSTIADNSGDGLHLDDDNVQTPIIVNSIIHGNTGQQIYSGAEDILNISYSNVADSAWAGTGNIDVDPHFVDAANDDYRLLASSQCINAGHPDSTDSDGSRSDMGAYPYLNTYSGPNWYVSTAGNDTTADGSSGDPFASIQAGINFATTAGDSVSVAAGTYVENINFRGRNIKVLGEDRETTIIDGNQSGSVVAFNSGETSAAVLSGFTIQNGSAVSGGGIYCNYSSPTLTNLTLSGNTSWAGGGIYFMGLSPNLVNVTISGNTASFEGGGIYCQNSNLSLENVTISGNWSDNRGGGIFCHNSSLVLENVKISGNVAPYGGGIYFSGPSLSLINATISGNTADYGGGFYCGSSSIDLINTVVWNNSPQEIYFDQVGEPNSITIIYSDIQGGQDSIVINDNDTVIWGDGNIDVDPRFFDPENGNYNLLASSLCINAGHPDSTDSDGTRADMGAYPYLNTYSGPDWYVSTTGDDTTGTGAVDDPFVSIQAGINFATTAGDSVAVAAGTYVENINFRGRAIVVFGEDRETTIIDGNQAGSVLTFNSGETSSAVLSGFTIQNGNSGSGGGIKFSGSTPTLIDLSIVNNSAAWGGGFHCGGSSPSFQNVSITGNNASNGGGGIIESNSNPNFINVTISSNSAYGEGGGIQLAYGSSPILTDVIISSNTVAWGGGGMAVGAGCKPVLNRVIISGNTADIGGGLSIHGSGSDATFTNATMYGNVATSLGGGIYSSDSATISVVNTILWNNSPEEVYFDAAGHPTTITVSYSDIQGGLDSIVTNDNGTVNWGDGNIDVDPLFVDAANGNFNLTGDSPVIDAGDPDPQYNDPDGTIADMGAFYYDQTGQPVRVQRLVTSPGTDNISLKWDANSEANLSSYNVYRSTTTGANFTSVASVASPDTEYVDSAVDPDVTYYYRVGAVDTDSDEGLLALEEHGRIAPDSAGLTFDGIADYISVDGIPYFTSSMDYTVELWVKASYTDAGFPYKRNLIERTDFLLSLSSPATGEFYAELTVGTLTLTGITSLIDERWHHIAARLEGSENHIQLWVDGSLEAGNAGIVDGTGYFWIAGPASPFDGVVDEVRVSDITRYRSGFIPRGEFAADNNTLALWHFNEGSTDAATPAIYDVSGNGYHGVIAGNPAWVEGPPFLADTLSYLVINEIMQNPASVSDAVGEWIEIHNQGFVPIHFDGWQLKDDGSDNHSIASSEFQVLPGDYVVLGINADTSVNGGVEVDYQYTGFSLTNAEDEVILMDGMGNEIDRVSYDGGSNFPGPNGKSMELITPYLNNNQGTNWTEAIRSYGGGDLGSPGRRNDAYSGQIVVADTLLNFGGVIEGMESLLSLVIHNTGVNELVIDTIFTQTGEFSPNPIGAVIGIGDSLTVNVTFMPTNPGDFVDLLTISSDDPLAPSVAVALQGYGINELQDIVITSATDDSVSAINFPLTRIVSSREMTLTLTNVGSAVLEIDEITITGDAVFTLDMTAATLPMDDSVQVTVTFDPQEEGDYSAVLSFSSNDPDEGLYAVQLTGTGSQYIVLFVPSEYSTIQAALDTAFSGDTVQVAAGTYFENIAFADSNLVLRGAGPGLSIIDGSSSGSVVTITGLDSTTILEGFTIQNGSATAGGGIRIIWGNPTLKNLSISGNTASGNGGGIHSVASTTLENVTVSGNIAGDKGGGIFFSVASSPLVNVTVTGNTAANFGGGIYCYNDAHPTLVNTILWNNSPQEVHFSEFEIANSITISYSDIQDGLDSIVTNGNGTVNWGAGNMNSDPLFVDADGGDLHLQWASPAIDAGDPSTPQDPDGTVIEMGAYSYDQSLQPPDPPDLSAVPGNGLVTISWSPPVDPRGNVNGDITGYIVYSGLQSYTMDSLAYVIADDTIYTDMGTDGHLINGETYRYSIVAIDTSNLYSVPSDTISAIPIGGAFVLADTLYDFGQFDHNETGSWDLIMENTGNGALNLSDISTATSWFTVSDDTLTIPVGSTDTVRVTFWTDFTSGVVNDTITITSDDLDHPTVQIAISAESVWPVVDLSATELPFGDVKVYQPMTVPLTLFNDGTDTLFVDSIFVTTDTVFTVAVASGQTSLALLNRIKDAGTLIQKSVYPAVRNERIGETGNQRREIGRKSSNDRKQKTTNRLGRLSTPPRHDAQARRAGNNRSGDSNRAGTDIIGQITPNMTSIRISSNILPGDTLTLDITFFTSDTGSFVSELRITSDDPVGNSDILVPLSARSIAPAISLSANALDFGNAWNGDSVIVNITNVGTDTLHIVDITVSDSEFTTEITATSIFPNATADLTVHFAPPGTGYWEGSLIISSDAYLANQISVEMKAIALPIETYDLGQVLLNRDSIHIRNYDNIGNTTLIIDSVVTTHSTFSVQLNSNSIAPGQTLEVTTSFTPMDKATYQADEILFTSQIGDGFTITQLSGEGITYPQSNFSTKSLSVVTYRGNDTQFSFDLSNSGDFPLDYSIDVDADWFGFIWLELINTEGLVTGLSTNTILVNVVNMSNLDPGTVSGRLYFNTNSGTTPTQIVRTDTVDIFLNLLADDTQLASGSAVISTGNPDPVNVLDDENNPIGLMLDFITSSGGTVNVLRVDAYPPIDSTTTYFDPSGLITSPVYAYEYFEITSDIQPGYTVHVGFDYTHLPGILDESKLRLARRVNNAGTAVPWDIVDISETEIDTEYGLIIARNQTQFSQWVLLSNTGENLFLDVLAPAFGVPGYTPESPGIMEDIVVTIPITDESGIASANLFYAEAGEWSYSEIAMAENSGEFSATIPGTVVTHSGVVYFITATDLLEYSSVSDTMGVEINFPNNDISTSSVSGSPYSGGYPSEKWRMLSIPAALDNNAVTNVIGDELGSQTDDIWRLFRYDANNQTYQDKPSNFNYGEGYWLYQTVENNLIFAATSGQTGNLDGSSIILKPLWNLIACPYPFPVSVQLDDILFYGPITYGQDGEGWTGEVSELKPWNGYAVYNRTGSDQTILIDPIPQPGMLAKEQIEEGWLLNLSTTAGEYTDLNNPLGCLVSAKDGLDYHDNPELLAPGNYLSLTYTNPSWGNVSSGLTSDIRKLSEDVQVWDVSITRKGISDLAYLTWNFTQSLPVGQVTRIVDLARKEVLDAQVDSDHKIGKLIGDIPYRLKVIAGYPEQVERTIEDIIFALPNEFALSQNYPNPFNPVTTLKFGLPKPRKIRLVVVNILGQEIVDLANGWYDLGYHQIRWDSRDNSGRSIASGVYFAILTDGKEIHVTKMIMLK